MLCFATSYVSFGLCLHFSVITANIFNLGVQKFRTFTAIYNTRHAIITLKAPNTTTAEFPNNAVPDETAHCDRLIWIYCNSVCLLVFRFSTWYSLK